MRCLLIYGVLSFAFGRPEWRKIVVLGKKTTFLSKFCNKIDFFQSIGCSLIVKNKGDL